MNNQNSFLENYELEGEQLKVFKYPAAVLKKKAIEVENFDNQFHQICQNMLYTMYNAPGIGLAAPQVGISQRFFVLDTEYNREEITNIDGDKEYKLSDFHPQVFVNPILRDFEGELFYEEGCLSVPGIFEDVKRANKITVDYQNIYGESKSITIESTLAVCIQHENDHLDGILFLERLSMLKRNFLQKKFIKSQKK